MIETVSIEFNGQKTNVPSGTTIAELLATAGVRTKLVAVEVNMEIVPRDQHACHRVTEGDVVEAVTLVGGG